MPTCAASSPASARFLPVGGRRVLVAGLTRARPVLRPHALFSPASWLSVALSLVLGPRAAGPRPLKLADRPAARGARDLRDPRRAAQRRVGGARGRRGGRWRSACRRARGRRVGRRRRFRACSPPPRPRALASGRGGAPCACFGARGGSAAASLGARRAARRRRSPCSRCFPRASSRPTSGSRSGSAPRCSASPRSPSRCSRWRARSACCAWRSAPQGALEIAGEGPELGGRTALAERFGAARRGRPRARGLHVARAAASAARSSRRSSVRARPARGRCGASTRPPTPTPGRWPTSPAARSRSRSAPTAPCSPRAPSTPARQLEVGARGGRAAPRSGACLSAERRDVAAPSTSRRGFLVARRRRRDGARGRGTVAASVVRPARPRRYHFCGHIYTTGSCPHPTGLPADRLARATRCGPRRPPVDDLGRPVDARAAPRRRGRPPAARPRRPRRCRRAPARTSATWSPSTYDFRTAVDGALVPLLRRQRPQARRLLRATAAAHQRRRRADRATATRGRKVFCVMYFQTKVPC